MPDPAPTPAPAPTPDAPTLARSNDTLFHRALYELSCFLVRSFCRVVYRTRIHGADNIPGEGAYLLAANHQSYLDPPMIGAFIRKRQVHFIARAGLFKFKPFAWLISSLNAFPLREDTGDAAAIREVIRLLGEGKGVMIFPEGSRTHDGAMHPFKRGVSLLVKKAKCPVIPAAIEGAWDAFPPGGKMKFIGKRVYIRYGEPIPHAELMKDGPDAALRRLEREIDTMRLDLRATLRAETENRFPAPGPGDNPITADNSGAPTPSASPEGAEALSPGRRP